MSVSLKVAYGIPAAKNIVENFLEILHQIAENYAIDYLLLDVSPNVGGLNEIALMSSDYFIVLTSPDYFCLQVIGSLTKNIEKWHIELINFKRLIKVNEKDYSVKNQPKFWGIVQQRYRPRKEKPASSFNVWIGKIREATNRELIPALQKINCTLDENLVEQILTQNNSKLKPYDLAHISDFNSLIAISQVSPKPVFSLTSEDIKNNSNVFGNSLETMVKNARNFNVEFSSLADRIIALIK